MQIECNPWQGASSAPGTAKVTHGRWETCYSQAWPGESTDGSHPGENEPRGWEGGCRFQNLWTRRIHTIRKSTDVTRLQGKTQMNVSFCEEQISFKLFSSPPPGSSMLHPSLHSRNPNLFIGSVYRCSNNTPPPKKNPRKTSSQL